jgi:protein MAK11
MRICAGTYERMVLGLDSNMKPFFAAEDCAAKPNAIVTNLSGKTIAAGFADDLIRVYNLDLKKEIGMLDKHRGTPNALAFLNNDNVMLSVADDGALVVWRVADWECLAVSTPSKHKATSRKKNKKEFEVDGEDESEDDDSEEETVQNEEIKKGGDPLLSLAVHPSEKLALSVNKKNMLIVWDLVKYSCAKIVQLDFATNNGIMSWTSDGNYYAIPSGTHLKVYDINSKLVKTLDNSSKVLCIKNAGVYASDIELLSNCLFTGAEDGKLRIWNVKDGNLLFESEASQSRIRALDTQSDSEYVYAVIGTTKGEIKLFRLSYSDPHSCSMVSEYNSSEMRITCISLAIDGIKKKKNNKKRKNANKA